MTNQLIDRSFNYRTYHEHFNNVNNWYSMSSLISSVLIESFFSICAPCTYLYSLNACTHIINKK